MKPFVIMTLGLCIGLCLGCSTIVKVINFKDTEFYTTTKDGETFYCISEYYMQQILDAKIKQVNP